MEKKTSTIGMVSEMQKIQAERRSGLEKSISEKKAALAELKDGKLDTQLLDSLLDDIKALVQAPVEVIVPLEDVIKEYDFGSFFISRCKNCFVWKTANYRAVIEPSYNYDLSNNGGSLYSVLTEICDLADKKDAGTITDDEEKSYDISIMLVSVAFTLPVMMFSDTTFAINVYNHIMDEFKASLERAQSKLNEETAEDVAANQEFERIMREEAEARKQAGK